MVNGVAVIGGMECRRDNDAGIEIDRVLRFVSQVRPTVLQLGDLGLRIGPADPFFVRQLFALAVAIDADEIVRTSASRSRSPWPSAAAFRDRSGHRPGAQWYAARHWPPRRRDQSDARLFKVG